MSTQNYTGRFIPATQAAYTGRSQVSRAVVQDGYTAKFKREQRRFDKKRFDRNDE
jgi:hypothetical protein